MLRHPLFAVALWIVVAYSASQILAGLVVLVLFALIALAVAMRRLRMGGVWLLCVVTALGIGAWRQSEDDSNVVYLQARAPDDVEAVALADAKGDEGFWQMPARLSDGTGARVWWQGSGKLPVQGSRIRACGSFHMPQAPRNPGEFDRREWMRQQGLIAIFRQQAHLAAQVQTPKRYRLIADVRERVRRAIRRGLAVDSDAAKVIGAVVLGDKPADDQELMEDFRNSGSMHVFSVSGLHVGMVAVLAWMVAASSGVSRRWLALPVIALVFAYALLTGANAPAVRAAWMATVFLGAFCLRRRPDLPNALGAVLLVMLIWDVRQLGQPSVQLSYGVVSAIAFGLPWTTRWFSRIGAAPLYMPVPEIKGLRLAWWRLRQWSATTLAVSTAASIGAAPLTLWHFGLITPVSVIAALFVLPLVFVVMALAMVSVLLSPLEMVSGPLMTGVNRLNSLPAAACAKVAMAMAHVPGGHWHTDVERGPLLLIYDLKYGDGASCWIPGKGDAAVLIDCGGANSFRHPLRSSMDRLGIEPDSVVITHPDGGHLGGGAPVWGQLPIRQALLPVSKARSPAYRAWLEQAPGDGVRLIEAASLQELPLAQGARLEWLHLPDAQNQDLPSDRRVLVMRLHWQSWKILWHSDAGSEAERAMLESGRDLRADVIVAGRHRGDLSLTDEFVDAVAPRVIIIGNDDRPEGERIGASRIRRWKEMGIAVFDQSECGAIHLRPDGDELLIEGFVNGRKRRLK